MKWEHWREVLADLWYCGLMVCCWGLIAAYVGLLFYSGWQMGGK